MPVNTRHTLLIAVGAGLLLALSVPLMERFQASRGGIVDRAELTLFPSGRFLRAMSLGHRHLVADIGWLTAIQYYGKHRRSDRRYPLATHLFTVITEADPAFENAYLFGALIMAEAGLTETAGHLLRRGAERNPDSWWLRFELGFYHYVITRSWKEAAASFAAAARLPGAPAYVRRFAAAAFERSGDAETARQLWQIICAQSDNPEIRRIAQGRIEELEGS